MFACTPASAQQDGDYKLGPEDVISITVLRHPEFSGEYLVPNDGNINVPRAGQIFVTGKTLTEVAALVNTGFKDTLVFPEVSVTLKSPRAQLVYMMGAVRSPGPYALKPGWRITEGISASGGLAPGIEPADCTVNILRASKGTKESVPYQEVVRGSETSNKPISAGDVVTVEAVEIIPVYVMGKVNRPGLYNMRNNSAGILEAITVAGGTTDDAALSKVTVTHLNGESETVSILSATIEGKQQSLVKLRSGDLVVVPDSNAKFAVLGWVNAPGFFPLKEGQRITLSDALGMARGTDNRRGGLRKVAILRTTDEKQERLVFDFEKFAKNGDMAQNPEVKSGDIIWVPETKKLDWDRVLSTISGGASLLWSLDRFGTR